MRSMSSTLGKNEGNVVIGYTSKCTLMLDCDMVREAETIEFAISYAKLHDLGSVLIMRSSVTPQRDLEMHILTNLAIIFGRLLSWEENMWHIQECYRLNVIRKSFTRLRKFGFITIRVNAKNRDKPCPQILHYFHDGDDRGTERYLAHWKMCRKLGTTSYSSNHCHAQ